MDLNFAVMFQEPYGYWLLQGFLTTLKIGFSSWLIAVFLSLVLASLAISGWKVLRIFASSFIELFRNIPLLLQLFIWFHVVPPLLGPWINRSSNLPLFCAIFGLGFYTSTRLAEHIKSGINGAPPDIEQAALSTALTPLQTFRYTILPYSIRLMIPPFTSEFLTIFKNSALAMTIGVLELTGTADRIGFYTFHSVEPMFVAIGGYEIIGIAIIVFMGFVEKKARIPGLMSEG